MIDHEKSLIFNKHSAAVKDWGYKIFFIILKATYTFKIDKEMYLQNTTKKHWMNYENRKRKKFTLQNLLIEAQRDDDTMESSIFKDKIQGFGPSG